MREEVNEGLPEVVDEVAMAQVRADEEEEGAVPLSSKGREAGAQEVGVRHRLGFGCQHWRMRRQGVAPG